MSLLYQSHRRLLYASAEYRKPCRNLSFLLGCIDTPVSSDGTLDNATIAVTSEKEHTDEAPPTLPADHPIEQTDKPRAGIAAEYLAKGYALSDAILQRAIEIDQKQGISTRFLNYLKHLDNTVGQKMFKPETDGGTSPTVSRKLTATVKSVDEQKGISKIATDVCETQPANMLACE